MSNNSSANINNCFSPIEDTNQMDTFEERGKHNTKGLKSDLDKRLRQMDMQRKKDVPPPLKAMGRGGPELPPGGNSRALNSMQQDPISNRMTTSFRGGHENIGDVRNPMLPPQEQYAMQQQRTDKNQYTPTMGGMLGRPDNHFKSGGGDRDNNGNGGGMRFPPPPPTGNPLQAPGHPGMAPRVDNNRNVPQLPPGLNRENASGSGSSGGFGGGFSAFESAFSGQTLMGTPMKTQSHTRREIQVPGGLPGGRGHAGTFQSAVNTSRF